MAYSVSKFGSTHYEADIFNKTVVCGHTIIRNLLKYKKISQQRNITIVFDEAVSYPISYPVSYPILTMQ